ncbi:UNKNOWN [Stylonychia lemnae]|uniref:Transmembrane protein n=1 Tax=Stylonychia lemnae TaxID=5949 RepID=A0A078A3M0_STYLE|nr:UNKNOWN [Stylonychia lemnae]|eukprot:CDW76412.1 UNKNOWN [Stylonychia lemnae]
MVGIFENHQTSITLNKVPAYRGQCNQKYEDLDDASKVNTLFLRSFIQNYSNSRFGIQSDFTETVYPTIDYMMPPYIDDHKGIKHFFPIIMNFQDYNIDVFNVRPKTYADGIQQIGSMLALLGLTSTMLFILNRYFFNKKLSQRLKKINGLENETLQELLTFDTFCNMKKQIDLQQSKIDQLVITVQSLQREQQDFELSSDGETKTQNFFFSKSNEKNKRTSVFQNIQ